jgi:hypothetical protein
MRERNTGAVEKESTETPVNSTIGMQGLKRRPHVESTPDKIIRSGRDLLRHNAEQSTQSLGASTSGEGEGVDHIPRPDNLSRGRSGSGDDEHSGMEL